MASFTVIDSVFLRLFAAHHPGQLVDAVFDLALLAGTPIVSLGSLHPAQPERAPAPFFLDDELSVFAEHELRATLEALAGFHAPLPVEQLSAPLGFTETPGRVGVLRCGPPFPALALAVSTGLENGSGVLLALADPDGSVPVLWRALPHMLGDATADTVQTLLRSMVL